MNYLEISFLFALLAIMPFGSNGLQSCYTCASTDRNCADGPFDSFPKPCTTKCFTKLENGQVSRGCLAPDDNTCTGPNCDACSTDNCNVQKTCWVCESKTDSSCLLANAQSTNMKVCALASPNCIVQVAADKTVSRSCANNDEKTKCDQNPDSCRTCTKSNCNEGVFPPTRLQCYQCTGADCNDISKQTAKPCAFYEKADQCFTFGESSTSMLRGCNSDPQAKCTASSTDRACVNCGSDQCNSRSFERQSLCVQCDSSKDKTCAGEMKEADSKPCAKKFQYHEEEQCYVQQTNGVTYRGCLNDRPTMLGDCTTQNSGCTSCASDGCNRLNVDLTCIRCRSDENAQCRNEAGKISGQKCTNTEKDKEDLCYYGTWNNVVIRGCMVDASASMQYQCRAQQDTTCSYCSGANCNIARAGASAIFGLGSLLLTLIATVTWRLY